MKLALETDFEMKTLKLDIPKSDFLKFCCLTKAVQSRLKIFKCQEAETGVKYRLLFLYVLTNPESTPLNCFSMKTEK